MAEFWLADSSLLFYGCLICLQKLGPQLLQIADKGIYSWHTDLVFYRMQAMTHGGSFCSNRIFKWLSLADH